MSTSTETTKKKLLETLLNHKFPQSDDIVQRFINFNEFHAKLCKHIEDAYGIGYAKGFEEGVNCSIQIKKN